MPKLSVSVPDELWSEALARAGSDAKASQVVQRSLRLFVTDRPSDALAPSEGVSPERFAEVLAGLVGGYRAEFARGYEAGLEVVRACGFEGLDMWMRYGADLNELWEAFANLPQPHDSSASPELLELSEEIWFEIGGGSVVFLDGLRRAFDDLWEALKSVGQQPTPAAPAEPVSEEAST